MKRLRLENCVCQYILTIHCAMLTFPLTTWPSNAILAKSRIDQWQPSSFFLQKSKNVHARVRQSDYREDLNFGNIFKFKNYDLWGQTLWPTNIRIIRIVVIIHFPYLICFIQEKISSFESQLGKDLLIEKVWPRSVRTLVDISSKI